MCNRIIKLTVELAEGSTAVLYLGASNFKVVSGRPTKIYDGSNSCGWDLAEHETLETVTQRIDAALAEANSKA